MKHQNKRRDRTEALIQVTARRRIAEQADNAIEQHRFDKLIYQGVIIKVKSSADNVVDGAYNGKT